MEDLSKSYTGTSYNLITKNCNHFCNDMSLRLIGKRIPHWINRLAKIGEQLLLRRPSKRSSVIGGMTLFTEAKFFESFGTFRGSLGDGTPTDQLSSIKQTLKDLQRKREERMKEFCDIQSQIIQVHEALRGSAVDEQIVDDKDLTTKRLRELKLVLQGLQSEKKRNPRFVPVYLNIYDLHPINGSIHWLGLGLGLYHFGIQGHVQPFSLVSISPKSTTFVSAILICTYWFSLQFMTSSMNLEGMILLPPVSSEGSRENVSD
ncbi:hypothetical protein Sjap_004914 [Stephania japonica]|uniref:PPPDE domain-containing protein n=1 Tax=Stephania japonica TaxID=461633 RepID=A0AAP0K3B6_9MAGN